MELHTLGVNGGYSEEDIITLARIFTGWGFCKAAQFEDTNFCFLPQRHDPSQKVFLSKLIPAGGMEQGELALDLLAHRPATAQHISYRLAQYFLTDQPPDRLVERMAATFLKTDGDIRAVLANLFDSAEFWDDNYLNSKFKSPYQFIMSAVRATGLDVKNPRPLGAILQQLGMRLYGCITPDGYKNTEAIWLSPYAMTRRLDWVSVLATGRLPLESDPPPLGVTPSPLAHAPIPFDPLLTTLGKQISHKTQQIAQSVPPPLKAAAVLGSPEFMYR
jgi:uncharacterized protein (DUF1800 family)